MKPTKTCATSLAFLLRYSPSTAFVVAGWRCPPSGGTCSIMTASTFAEDWHRSRGSLKGARPSSATRASSPSSTSLRASEQGEWEGGQLLELDVVEYRVVAKEGESRSERLEIGAYVGNGILHPLLVRESSGPNLFFHDEDAESVSVDGGSCRIVRVLDQVYVSQRIVEDRVKNPHGEEAEDCFLVEEALNPAIVIRVERDA